jgi:putative nucleotidyltransferase with HDIG domain
VNEKFSELIILLASGINQRRMYFDDHPRVKAAGLEFLARLAEYFTESGESCFSFGVFGGKFIRNGKYLVGPSIAGRSLIEFAEQIRCGGFEFRPGLEADDLATFFRLAAAMKVKLGSLEDAKVMFTSHGIPHIRLVDGFREEGEEGGSAEDDAKKSAGDFLTEDFAPLLDIYQDLYEAVAGNNLAMSRGETIDVADARAGGKRLVAAGEAGAMDVMQFLRYPDYDSYTIGHSVRVAALAALLARVLGWSTEMQEEIATAGLVHDLGKGKVPAEILFKAGSLDENERKIIESHPALGAQILVASGERSPVVVSAAWGHHIREDGGGYPAMPSWYRAGDASALVHVCDVFEALTAVRPYKAPMSPRRAFEIMLEDRAAFRPRMLVCLIRALGLYPPGSEVLLTDGSRGVVVARGEEIDSPQVKVTHTAAGQPIPASEQPAVRPGRGESPAIEEFITVGLGDPASVEPVVTG